MSWGRRVELPEEPWTWPEPGAQESNPAVTASTSSSVSYSNYSGGAYDGSNWLGSISGQVDEITHLDYWTLRRRSAALFYGNLYARGIIRRLVTNVINTGLEVECVPEEKVLGLAEEALVDWAELVENRYRIYGQSPDIIDAKGRRTDGDLQRQIYMESLICGDCLVVNRQDPSTGLPQIEIVNGDRVRTPFSKILDNTVVDGVHIDKRGRHLGYWVYEGTNEFIDNRYIYIPARGEQSGRRTAWMVYGPDKREDGVRGEPLLGIAIQALKEISDYRGSAQRKAAINSMIVGFIKRTMQGVPSGPVSAAAVKATSVTKDATGETNAVHLKEVLPGMFFERLQPGEEPSPYAVSGTDVNFGPFEAAILAGVSWALEIPPEILLLGFHKAFNASQAAINEFKLYLNKERPRFAGEHCQLLLEEWFIAEVLLGRIQADGFLESLTDPEKYDVQRAWLLTDWNGAIKPSADIVKQTKGYVSQMSNCLITADRACRELTGMKFTKVVRRRRKENELVVAAIEPILKAKRKYGEAQVEQALKAQALPLEGVIDATMVDAAN